LLSVVLTQAEPTPDRSFFVSAVVLSCPLPTFPFFLFFFLPLSSVTVFTPRYSTVSSSDALPAGTNARNGSLCVNGVDAYLFLGPGLIQELFRYDSVLDQWTGFLNNVLPSPRHGLVLASLGDLLFAAGGVGYSSINLYSLSASNWLPSYPMPVGRSYMVAASVRASGGSPALVVFAGGFDSTNRTLS
jgi:hypothetical protein